VSNQKAWVVHQKLDLGLPDLLHLLDSVVGLLVALKKIELYLQLKKIVLKIVFKKFNWKKNCI
jgi:hypothetical protein